MRSQCSSRQMHCSSFPTKAKKLATYVFLFMFVGSFLQTAYYNIMFFPRLTCFFNVPVLSVTWNTLNVCPISLPF